MSFFHENIRVITSLGLPRLFGCLKNVLRFVRPQGMSYQKVLNSPKIFAHVPQGHHAHPRCETELCAISKTHVDPRTCGGGEVLNKVMLTMTINYVRYKNTRIFYSYSFLSFY